MPPRKGKEKAPPTPDKNEKSPQPKRRSTVPSSCEHGNPKCTPPPKPEGSPSGAGPSNNSPTPPPNPKHAKRKDPDKPPPSLKEGGQVKKTGLYRLHKGEVVVPAKIVNKKK
jgi:hypothetical protein